MVRSLNNGGNKVELAKLKQKLQQIKNACQVYKGTRDGSYKACLYGSSYYDILDKIEKEEKKIKASKNKIGKMQL